jgi:hypothetical protein
MKESHGEGLARHTGPESCVTVCKGRREALTGERTGPVLSRESTTPSSDGPLRGADAVEERGRPHGSHRYREMRHVPARSETRGMCRHLSCGNREVLRLPATRVAGRIAKSQDVRR